MRNILDDAGETPTRQLGPISVCEVLVIFVIRPRRIPFITSRLGKWLTVLTLSAVAFGTILQFMILDDFLGFTALPVQYWALLVLMVATYLLLVDAGKVFFYKICKF